MHSYYESILATDNNENFSSRYQNLCDGIEKIHCTRPVGCIKKKSGFLVLLGNAVFCYIEVDEEFYRVYTTYTEWVQNSKRFWDLDGDIVSCCMDMPDECIGEVSRLIQYVEKHLAFTERKSIYNSQLEKSGLDAKDAFKGDPREKFKIFFSPLIEGTDYYFEDSGDGKILNFKKIGVTSRRMGFQARVAGEHKGMMYTFFDHQEYEKINSKIGLPENVKKDPNKKQEHVYIPLEKLWNCICVITGKLSEMV